MEEKTLTKSAGKAAFGTMFSRILGYVRDMLVANMFGAGIFADAFYAAFRIPNLFRRIFGEGAFSAAFIPVFSEYLHTKEKLETQKMLNSVFAALLISLFVISILGIIFAPFLVKLIAWGFSGDIEKLSLTIELTRFMFPFICFICLAAFLLAVLNALHSFFIPALAPCFLSVSEIFYMLAIAPYLISQNQIKGLALSVIVGGFLHFLVQYPKLKSLKWNLNFKINFKHPAVKQIFFLMLPSIIALSVDQINSFIDTICGSFLENGSITSLYYSNRLMQLPLAVFGLAFASVSLPALSKYSAQKDYGAFKDVLSDSIKLSSFAILPAAAGLMAVGLCIIRVLFERGRFDFTASVMTNSALFYYSIGLPAFSASKIFANAFYALKDTKTPVKAAAISMILHVVLCVVLMYHMKVGGLALATSLSSYLNAFILVFILKKKIGHFDLRNISISLCKTFAASLAAAFSAFYIGTIFDDNIYVSLIASVFSGTIIFIFISFILKSDELRVFFKTFINKTTR
jgi:putative peptidoglycan lipid II flippase